MARTYKGKLYYFKKVNGKRVLFVDGKRTKQRTKAGKYTQAYKIASGLVAGGKTRKTRKSCKSKRSSSLGMKKIKLVDVVKAAALIKSFDDAYSAKGLVVPKSEFAKARRKYLQFKALKTARKHPDATKLDIQDKMDYFYTGKNGGKAPVNGKCEKGDLQYLASGEKICLRKKKSKRGC